MNGKKTLATLIAAALLICASIPLVLNLSTASAEGEDTPLSYFTVTNKADGTVKLTYIGQPGAFEKIVLPEKAEDKFIGELEIPAEKNVRQLDVSKTSKLSKLVIAGNHISDLNLSSNPLLTYIDCEGNDLSGLSLSNLPDLEYLEISNNSNIGEVDLSSNTKLKTFIAHNTALDRIDFSNNKALTHIDISNTHIKSLNVSALKFLKELHANNSDLMDLSIASIEDNLEYLNVENCKIYHKALPALEEWLAQEGHNGKVLPQKTLVLSDADSTPPDDQHMPSYTYTGEEITPTVTLTYAGYALEEGTDYECSYTHNVNATTTEQKASVVLSAGPSGEFNSNVPKILNFTINKASLSGATITPIPDQNYTGKAITPTVTVILNGKALTEHVDYTVKYTDNFNIGTAHVNIQGLNNFTGSRDTSFNIIDPETKIDISETDIRAIPDQYYTGKAITPSVAITYNSTTLKENVDYTLSYKDNTGSPTEDTEATVTITGMGKFKGATARTFKIIAPGDKKQFSHIALSKTEFVYNGITPNLNAMIVTVTDTDGEQVNENDYTLEYSPAKSGNVGEYEVYATPKNTEKYAKGINTDTASYTIIPLGLSSSNIQADIPDQKYTGQEIKPVPEVIAKFENVGMAELKEGTDFEIVKYENNIGVKGQSTEATVTITGLGNYAGERVVKFYITPEGEQGGNGGKSGSSSGSSKGSSSVASSKASPAQTGESPFYLLCGVFALASGIGGISLSMNRRKR